MNNCRKCCLFGACIPLSLLCGIIAICVVVTGVLGIVGGINGEPTDPWYLMGAASLAALLLPFVATPLAWVVVEVLRNQADKASSEFSVPTEQPKTDEQVVKKQSRVLSVLVPGEGDSSPGAVRSEHDIADVDNLTNRRPTTELKARNIEFLEAEVYNVQPHKIDSSKFQSLNAGACAMLYITLMCFSLSIVCLLWSFFITVRVSNQASGLFWLVLVCHVLASFMCPAFAMAGLFLLSTVGNYITAGMADFTGLYCSMPAVKMVTGEMIQPPKFIFKFWVVADIFYIRLRSPRGNPKNLLYYIDRTPATYVLAAIVWLALSFSVWFFIESIQVQTMILTTPVTEDVCALYTCLRNWEEVGCSTGANITDGITVTCIYFRINRDPISILTILLLAFAIYYSAGTIFQFTITMTSFLLLIRQTKLWGLLLLSGHVLLLIVMVIWVSLDEAILTDIKSKLVVIPIFLILVDFLLLSGGVNEVIQEPQKTRCIIVKPKHYSKGVLRMNTLTEVELQSVNSNT